MPAREMTPDEISQVAEVAFRIATAMRDELRRQPLHVDQMRAALATATSMVVSYANMQDYLEELAVCADAKYAAETADRGTHGIQ